MPILGLKPIYLISEEFCYCTLTGSATTDQGKQPHFCNIHRLQQSKLATCLTNSCFNLKLNKCVGRLLDVYAAWLIVMNGRQRTAKNVQICGK